MIIPPSSKIPTNHTPRSPNQSTNPNPKFHHQTQPNILELAPNNCDSYSHWGTEDRAILAFKPIRQKLEATGRHRNKGYVSMRECEMNRTKSRRSTPITNGFRRRNQARRKFASTRRLSHKKIQRSILIADLICREYMKDAPAGQFASVNAIDGRGEEEDGTNRMDEYSSLRATSHQPTSNGGDKNTKALMAQQ